MKNDQPTCTSFFENSFTVLHHGLQILVAWYITPLDGPETNDDVFFAAYGDEAKLDHDD